MSFDRSYAKLLTERPRILELIDRDEAGRGKPGTERVHPKQALAQLEPLLGFIADGRLVVPADQQVRVGKALEALYRQAQRGGPLSDEEE